MAKQACAANSRLRLIRQTFEILDFMGPMGFTRLLSHFNDTDFCRIIETLCHGITKETRELEVNEANAKKRILFIFRHG